MQEALLMLELLMMLKQPSTTLESSSTVKHQTLDTLKMEPPTLKMLTLKARTLKPPPPPPPTLKTPQTLEPPKMWKLLPTLLEPLALVLMNPERPSCRCSGSTGRFAARLRAYVLVESRPTSCRTRASVPKMRPLGQRSAVL